MAYTDYSAVQARNTTDLAIAVNAAIADGWQPLAAPTLAANGMLVQPLVKGTPSGGGSGTVTAADITDATAVGRDVLTAANAAAARTAIGAGTSSLAIGTTAGTAMAGNTPIPPAATWANLSGKPAVIAAGEDAATARSAIGAGTSSLAIGTTASTAKAGNYTPPNAATGTRGLVLMGTAVADATDADDVVAQLNALLASLRTAGSLAT